jgi:hypothetical protein
VRPCRQDHERDGRGPQEDRRTGQGTDGIPAGKAALPVMAGTLPPAETRA